MLGEGEGFRQKVVSPQIAWPVFSSSRVEAYLVPAKMIKGRLIVLTLTPFI